MQKKYYKYFTISCLVLSLFGCGKNTIEQDHTAQSITSSSPTLKKITETGILTIGYHTDLAPFSYYSQTQQAPIGYSVDIANYVSKHIQNNLNNVPIQVKFKALKPDQTIDAVKSGLVDFECGVTKNKAEQNDVSHSINFFVTSHKFLIKKDFAFHGTQDLKDQTIAVLKDSEPEKSLQYYKKFKKVNIQIQSVRLPELFELLNENQIHMVYHDEAVLDTIRLRLKEPQAWHVVGDDDYVAYTCILRKDDERMKNLVDDSLTDLFMSGRVYALHNKWFKDTIPEVGVNLDYVLSLQNTQLFANPYDTPTADNVKKVTEDISKAFNIDSKN